MTLGGAKGNRPPPPRDLNLAGYAGAHAAVSAPNAEWQSAAIDSGRHELEFLKQKTKSDARKMVANMVAERLALCGMSAGAVSEPMRLTSTPARGGNGAAALVRRRDARITAQCWRALWRRCGRQWGRRCGCRR